jgi:RNA polymerase sigma-70 factor, ECF subfamily
MGIPRDIPGLNTQTINLIKHKAWGLIGTIGFTASDRDDIEQELAIDVLRRLPRYNPERAQLATFIVRIIDNKIASIIEARKSRFYDFRLHAYSLNEHTQDTEGWIIERGDEIDEDDYLQRTGWRCHHAHDLMNLKADIARILPTLPPELRDLCSRLQNQNVTDISAETGVPRYRIYAEIGRIREVFEQAGLRDYL